ncbi:MAG: ROK family protein [Spirochaetaceae bacterium]|nr:MAG: ROK family protein [Spirochaetaceae bacterium]
MQGPLRSYDIRERNEKLILKLIYDRGVMSQSEVASLTGLKAPTVFRIFASLENRRYIKLCEAGKEVSERKGRKPLFYCIDPDAHYVIGVDFWAGSASVVVVNFDRTPVYEELVDFPKVLDAQRVVQILTDLIEKAIHSSKISAEKILGIGIGAPGVVDLKQGSVLYYPRIRDMVDFNIRELLEREFSVPVYLHNNSSVIALSEYRYGKAKEFDSLLLILIRSGVGGSFISSGNIFVNRNQTALEIGHTVVDGKGRSCWCGQKGCLETELSEDAIVADLKQRTNLSSLEEIGETLAAGNQEATAVLSEKAVLLNRCIRNLYMVLRPRAFMIVTRRLALSDFFSASARKSLRSSGIAAELSQVTDLQSPEVLSDQYDPIMAGRGATDLVFDPFFASGSAAETIS